VLLGACEVEKVQIARPESRVAVHAVLSATAASQVVLLERTRNGSVSMVGPSFDLADPVVSDEGIAEPNAIVTLATPGGQTYVAREDFVTRGRGRGVYRLSLPGGALERGGAYRLSVRTTRGEVLTAETSVPGGAAAAAPEARTFDRARDTAVVAWDAVPGARSYFVRVETPFGPRSFFTDSTRLRLTGELRNPEVAGIPRVFIPGFPQAVTVSAVDSNYYDWYRTHNDAVSGAGLVSRVSGGLGVFGSLVRLRYVDFRVTAPQTEPAAGRFRFAGTAGELATTPFLGLELYVESRAARGDQADAISGRYDVRPRFGYAGCLTCGLLGGVKDGRLTLALLREWSARDTSDVFTGEIRGDTIVGSYRGFGGVVRFVRQR
jgi:hypothetical protein